MFLMIFNKIKSLFIDNSPYTQIGGTIRIVNWSNRNQIELIQFPMYQNKTKRKYYIIQETICKRNNYAKNFTDELDHWVSTGSLPVYFYPVDVYKKKIYNFYNNKDDADDDDDNVNNNNNDELNYYEILGVTKNSSKEEIVKSFKRLATKVHPDQGGNEYLFRLISKAKDELIK